MSLLKAERARIAILSTSIGAILFAVSVTAFNSRVFAAKRAAGDNARAASPAPAQHSNANPVLVELFTSEGCSDCPPADSLLAHLQNDQPVPSANIIALEEHVDYWDHLGWRDRFSSPDITARQGEYTRHLQIDDNYTPQMIVDGTDQFVGSDSAHALRAIASAARTPKLPLVLSSVNFAGANAVGKISVGSAPGKRPNADLYAVLVQRTASTSVLRGENGGHTLHHVSTVLALEKIGDTRAAAGSLSFSVNLPKGADPANLALVVFAQQPDQGAILGCVSSAVRETR